MPINVRNQLHQVQLLLHASAQAGQHVVDPTDIDEGQFDLNNLYTASAFQKLKVALPDAVAPYSRTRCQIKMQPVKPLQGQSNPVPLGGRSSMRKVISGAVARGL